MKHLILIGALFLITMVGTSQTWYGSDVTLHSGTYAANIGANITIAPNSSVEFTTLQLSSGSLHIGRNSTVIIDQLGSPTLNGGIILDSSSTLLFYTSIVTVGPIKISPYANFSTSASWDISNGSVIDSGNLVVAGTVTLRQPNVLTFSGCGDLVTNIINNQSAPNPVSGTGYISLYQYTTNGNSFTASTSLSIRYSGGNLIAPAGVVSPNATAGCSVVTPVLYSGFSAKNVSGNIYLSWTTYFEQNNKYFVLEGSIDGKTFDSVATIQSHWATGNSGSSYTYNYWFKNSVIKTAGMDAVLILILITTFMMMFKTKSMKFATLFVFSLFVLACHKTNETTANHTTYSFFRIKQVDLDGTTKYNQTIVHI